MVNILLIGTEQKQKRVSSLYEILRKNFAVCHAGDTVFASCTSPADFMIYEPRQFVSAKAERCIVVCKDPFVLKEADIPKNAVGVLSSGNEAAAAFLQKCAVKALVLGMSSKDTLTLSSITSDSATICLQRGIEDFFHNTVDPAEIPILLSKTYDTFSVLAAAAVLFISGKAEEIHKMVF